VSATSGQRDLEGLTILNLGSGIRPIEEAVNLDITAVLGADVVHDLNEYPWPFPDNRFREVIARDVLEHLDDLVLVMEELHRVCEAGARIEIGVPHFSSANQFIDPTHRHAFGVESFDYFTGEHEHFYYTQVRFRTVARRIGFYPGPLEPLVRRLASRWPSRYERRWAWIYPAWYLLFELEVVK
jgi:SAM-dependent methyltransferase